MDKKTIGLRIMTEEEFPVFKKRSISEYAFDLMNGQGMTREEAFKSAEEEFDEALADWPDTPDQFVMKIDDTETGDEVGWMWYAYEDDEDGKQVFLCDFLVYEEQRRRGYASAALAEMERRAKADGLEYAALIVWDHNPPGQALYKKCGYAEKERGEGYSLMKKKISEGNMEKKYLFEKLARDAFEKEGFNGTWLYAENGEIVSKGAVGWLDPESTVPLTEDSIFQLASVTKQFTAAAVMLAVRRGLFGLDDELTKFIPELTKYKGATVRHLLTHTSGIPDYFDDWNWFVNIWKEEHRIPGNDEIVRFLLETEAEPYGAPGEVFSYSNTGYNLLALLVEKLSGVPFEEFLKKNVFEPAGMTNTRCCHVRRDGVPFGNYARATVYDDEGGFQADVDSEAAAYCVPFDGLNGDDYVYTTILDMFKWDRALREEKVLTLEEQKLMYTPGKLNNGENAGFDDEGEGYGFGWIIEHDEKLGLIVSHSGGMPGVNTWFFRFVDADRVLVTLNSREWVDARAGLGFEKATLALAKDKEPEPIVSIEDIALKDPDKSNWESFCGKYEHPEDEDFIIDGICLKDGELFAKAIDEDGDDFEFRLYPIGESEFVRKGGMIKLTFGEGCLTYGGNTCKKQ